MTESEIRQLIRQMIQNEIVPIIMGEITATADAARSSVRRLSAEAPRNNVRSIAPFGISSRAPAGTPAFIVPAGNDQTNQNVVGHFDAGRPPVGPGEVALYDAYGHVLYLSQSKIQLGSAGSSENLVLGKVLQNFLEQLLMAIAEHTHPSPGAPPTNAAKFTTLQNSPVADGGILSDVSYTEK